MCINPNTGRAPCVCASCMQEKQVINSLRNRACLSNYNNPLVEWTLSPEWTNPASMRTFFNNQNPVAGEIPWR